MSKVLFNYDNGMGINQHRQLVIFRFIHSNYGFFKVMRAAPWYKILQNYKGSVKFKDELHKRGLCGEGHLDVALLTL